MLPFGTETVTVVRASRVLDHGSLWDDWDTPAVHDIEGCVVQPGDSTEDNTGQTGTFILFTVLAPEGADILDTDKVRLPAEPDLELAVYGRPQRVTSPTGSLNHVLVRLQEWKVT